MSGRKIIEGLEEVLRHARGEEIGTTVRYVTAKPWAEPGKTIAERAGALTHALTLQKHGMKLKRMDLAAEALRAARADALEEAALEIELYCPTNSEEAALIALAARYLRKRKAAI